jgi:hypothetical protein
MDGFRINGGKVHSLSGTGRGDSHCGLMRKTSEMVFTLTTNEVTCKRCRKVLGLDKAEKKSMNLQDMIKVMQAAIDGKGIEYNNGCGRGWEKVNDVNNLAWNWHRIKYRVKKEPRVFYANVYPFIMGALKVSQKECNDTAQSGRTGTIKLVEVLDDTKEENG